MSVPGAQNVEFQGFTLSLEQEKGARAGEPKTRGCPGGGKSHMRNWQGRDNKSPLYTDRHLEKALTVGGPQDLSVVRCGNLGKARLVCQITWVKSEGLRQGISRTLQHLSGRVEAATSVVKTPRGIWGVAQ
jgi:hypothetical protein